MGMRSTSMKVMAAALLVISGLALGSSPADAGGGDPLVMEPDTTDRQVGRWDFSRELQNGLVCDSPSYEVSDGEGEPVDEDLYEIEADPDPVTGTLTATGLPAGEYSLFVRCDQTRYLGEFAFGRLTVTKVVEGDAPDDATFVIEVECEGADAFTEELELGAEGGVAEVYSYVGPTTCEVTETDDGGAESTEIEGGTAEFDEPIDLAATVTNTFADTPPTTTTTVPTVPTTTTTPAAPAPTPAAQPAQATPRFVG
jgi:hypothetical protein